MVLIGLLEMEQSLWHIDARLYLECCNAPNQHTRNLMAHHFMAHNLSIDYQNSGPGDDGMVWSTWNVLELLEQCCKIMSWNFLHTQSAHTQLHGTPVDGTQLEHWSKQLEPRWWWFGVDYFKWSRASGTLLQDCILKGLTYPIGTQTTWWHTTWWHTTWALIHITRAEVTMVWLGLP
jgi:hypothetical protein